MTLCTPNPLTSPIPSCTETLTIGMCDIISSDLSLYIKNITTGRIEIIAAESDADGLITADLTDFTPMPSHTYEFWLTEEGDDMTDKIDVIISGEESDTYALRFESVVSGSTEESFTTQTLTRA